MHGEPRVSNKIESSIVLKTEKTMQIQRQIK
jgi:hypothetical protein